MKRHDKKEKRTLAVYLSIFILLAAGIALAGYISYRGFEQQFRAQAGRQLSSIAELKVNELVDWRRGMLADAEMLYQNHAFATLVQAYFENQNNVLEESQIQDWLKNYQENNEYDHVRLMDAKGRTHLSYPIGIPPISSIISEQIPEVLQSKKMTLFDFYRRDNDQKIRLSLLVPIMDVQTGQQIIGLVAISIDPEIYLYPFIEQWPVDSASAETLLVRRDGNDVLFLNRIRFNPNAALVLRFPLTDTKYPAVEAALGQTGVVEGIDYRGEQVLADVRPVPDSPWFLVSKMDTAEVYAPLRARLWQTLGLVGMAVFVAGMGLLAVWRQQRFQIYRAQAEAAETLRKSEEKYRSLFNNSEVGMFITRLDGSEILEFNEKYLRILNYSMEELKGKPSKDLWADQAEREKIVQLLNAEGSVTDFECGIVNKQGEARRCLMSVRLYRDTGILEGSIQDITERKRAEVALRESERQLKETQVIAGLGSYALDFSSSTWTSSDVLDSIFGIDEKFEHSIAGWSDLIHPADRQHMTDYLANEVTGKHLRFDKEYRIVRKNDGAERWVYGLGKLEFDAQDQLFRMLGIIQDITERKQAEEALRESEERLKLAQQSSNAGWWDWDMTTSQLKWSRELFGLFGFDPEKNQATFEVWDQVMHPDDKTSAYERLDIAVKNGTYLDSEYRVIQPGGQVKWIKAMGHAIYDTEHKPMRMAGICLDITERKQAEKQLAEYAVQLEEVVNERTRELREAHEKLVRQEKLALLGLVAGSMSHELRNPLGVISNAIYFLKMAQPNASDQIKEYLTIIENEARTSDKIITDLLDFTRLKPMEREVVSVSELIHQTLERYPAPPSVEVLLEIPTDLPPVFVDPRQMIQVLGNLTVNACQAMKDGGQLSLFSALKNDMITIIVKDSGVGIPPENMRKLFEPLFTTKTKGIGLGLAVSQKLTEANGGRIKVQSESGVGSTFTVWLPIQK
jgi:PAS domain S-box-containing protein